MDLTDDITGLPSWILMRYRFSSEPDEISTSIVRDRMMIIANAEAVVVHELGLFGGPADLHHASSTNSVANCLAAP